MSWDQWLTESKPVMPVIVVDRVDDAVPMARALVAGGVRLLEVTLRTECALEAIAAIKAEVPEAILGAGTVTRPEELHQVINSGAEFVVSPGFTRDLLAAAQEWGGAFLPGVATPSEVMQVRDAGFERMKFFPAVPNGGRSMLKAIGGPLPDISFCPTGGISAETYHDFLALENVFAVGGSWLTPADLMSARNWQAIKSLADAV
ncbi:MAG: keto-deoxy-phosphogluconate aldolase [Pseudomonas sp.]|nr:keto-deoxy-phosphogluconate aldolase [Pseudomonas sp.]